MVNELNTFIELTKDRYRLLDIGALHGIFSVVFTRNCPTSSSIVVDASPVAFSKLLYNIYSNNLLDKIKALECALSDQDAGFINMHYVWEHLISAGTQTQETNQSYLSVKMRTGDSICEEHSFMPDTIKIDVEGHEVKVLRGLRKIISKELPLIFLELHPYQISQEGNSIQDIVDFFHDFEYQVYCSETGINIPWGKLSDIQENFHLVIKQDGIKP